LLSGGLFFNQKAHFRRIFCRIYWGTTRQKAKVKYFTSICSRQGLQSPCRESGQLVWPDPVELQCSSTGFFAAVARPGGKGPAIYGRLLLLMMEPFK